LCGLCDGQVRIVRFETQVEVMVSKERPKKITAIGSDGNRYHFLCKMERKGDLRKDSRLMECCTVVNRYAAWSLGRQ
jgi:serine/threonine-protein kinase ATR